MNERKGRGRDWLRGQGAHHQGGREFCVRQERRTLGPRRKAVQDGFAADIGLNDDSLMKLMPAVKVLGSSIDLLISSVI